MLGKKGGWIMGVVGSGRDRIGKGRGGGPSTGKSSNSSSSSNVVGPLFAAASLRGLVEVSSDLESLVVEVEPSAEPDMSVFEMDTIKGGFGLGDGFDPVCSFGESQYVMIFKAQSRWNSKRFGYRSLREVKVGKLFISGRSYISKSRGWQGSGRI